MGTEEWTGVSRQDTPTASANLVNTYMSCCRDERAEQSDERQWITAQLCSALLSSLPLFPFYFFVRLLPRKIQLCTDSKQPGRSWFSLHWTNKWMTICWSTVSAFLTRERFLISWPAAFTTCWCYTTVSPSSSSYICSTERLPVMEPEYPLWCTLFSVAVKFRFPPAIMPHFTLLQLLQYFGFCLDLCLLKNHHSS